MRILGVGIATLDVICRVDAFPKEDDEIRARALRICRGGNATNTLVTLAELGNDCAWAGSIADEPDSRYIQDDLSRFGIDMSCAEHLAGRKVPTSYVLSSAENGSRTIVHYRDLPEYSAQAFETIDLSCYDWVHFEGRNVDELGKMLARVSAYPGLRSSLEVEKPRADIESLFALADVLLFSKQYARHRGCDDASKFLGLIKSEVEGKSLFCAWGDQGGAAVDSEGLFSHSPAFAPAQVIDTLGAGDVFNAGVIHALLGGAETAEALEIACRLAGNKCGREGFAGVTVG